MYREIINKYGVHGVISVLSGYIKEERLNRFKKSIDNRILNVAVVVENLYDLHNAAAVTRSAEALGVMNVYFIGSRDNWKITKKISMKAEKWINIRFYESVDEVHEVLSGYRHWVAIPPEPSRPTSEIDFNKTPVKMREISCEGNIALWFGNEREGLSNEAVNKASDAFYIPLYGLSQSLNLSVSAAISIEYVCNELRRNGKEVSPDKKMSDYLLARYLSSSVKEADTILQRYLADEYSVRD